METNPQAALGALGFVPMPMLLDKAFEWESPDVTYLVRRAPQCHYLTLTQYDGRFVEACFHVFHAPRGAKPIKCPAKATPQQAAAHRRSEQTRGAESLFGTLYRSIPELLEAVGRTYPLSP